MHRLTLSVRNLDDPDTRAAFERVVRTASAVDGQPPFSDQSLIDVTTGARTLIFAVEPQDPPAEPHDFAVIGVAILGQGELEFVVEPEWRGNGYGKKALEGVLGNCAPAVKVWAHGDHPASRKLAATFGFEAVRTLLQLRRSAAPEAAASEARAATSTNRDDLTITPFRVGEDETDWLAVNALAFATHPEQGKMTIDDLRAREADTWFDAEDFLLARDADGTLVGFNWLKVEDGEGEIYAIGVHPDHAGRGIGRTLMEAGLERLEGRDLDTIALYVEADNTAAVNLYRSLGFTDHTIDVQYSRPIAS
jgi:mycothiol synthase